MPQLYVDSFCDRLAWIHRNSQGMGLIKLDRYHRNELLKAIHSARQTKNFGFTEFEIQVLSLVVAYSCYFQNKQPVPFSKFERFRKPEHYYRELDNLVSSNQRIGSCSVCLSSLVKDDHISSRLKSIEQVILY